MPGASSVSSQSDWAKPRPSVRNAWDSSNAVVAKTDVPEPDAVGEEAAGDQRRGERARRVGRAAGRPRRRRPTAPWSERAVAPGARWPSPSSTSAPIRLQPGDHGVERARRRPPRRRSLLHRWLVRTRTISRWARWSLRQVATPETVGSPGTRPTTSANTGARRVRVGHLEDEVAEFESGVPFCRPLVVCQASMRAGKSRSRVGSKRVRASRGRHSVESFAAAATTANSGVNG